MSEQAPKRRRFAFTWSGLALVLLGAALFGGGRAAVDYSNTEAFCISCHEMKDNNYAEYSHTIHARNRTGVRAICSDCHVPHGFVDTLVRKVKASNDLYHHFRGTIATRREFEAHRRELASRVWTRMIESDSRECRNCHDAAAMDPDLQGRTAAKQHLKLRDGSRTCIDCHYGIAHQEPEGVEPRDVVATGAMAPGA